MPSEKDAHWISLKLNFWWGHRDETYKTRRVGEKSTALKKSNVWVYMSVLQTVYVRNQHASIYWNGLTEIRLPAPDYDNATAR